VKTNGPELTEAQRRERFTMSPPTGPETVMRFRVTCNCGGKYCAGHPITRALRAPSAAAMESLRDGSPELPDE
jgi:hypothetical protein